MSAFFAFLHHLAAFALVAAVAIEFVLIKETLTIPVARRLLRVDFAFGIAAGIVLIVGLLRVFYFEKGADYYFHSAPFIAKVALFFLIGLLSIYPTMEFISWRKSLRQGLLPVVAPDRMRRLRTIVHIELAGIALIILCAVLMARGIGYFG